MAVLITGIKRVSRFIDEIDDTEYSLYMRELDYESNRSFDPNFDEERIELLSSSLKDLTNDDNIVLFCIFRTNGFIPPKKELSQEIMNYISDR